MTYLSRPVKDVQVDTTAAAGPKQRLCLMCRADFPSGWSGERLCPRCKSTSAWRGGTPFGNSRSGGRRSRFNGD